MSRRGVWIAGFLGVTAGALTAECWASWDTDPDTVPWTELIVTYVPDELALFVIVGLIGWVPVHFVRRYRRKNRGCPVATEVVESRARIAADARSRAWRTLAQGLLLDVGYAVTGVLLIELTDAELTQAYWKGLGFLVLKTVAQTAAAWAMRHLKPPKVGDANA